MIDVTFDQSDDKVMTEDAFDKIWTTVTDKDDDDMLDWVEIKKYPANQRWTWIDGDDGRTYLVAGDHYVNVFAHAATTTPWVTGDEIMVLDGYDDLDIK